MNEMRIKIRYDISYFRFVDNVTSVENKTIFINDEYSTDEIVIGEKAKKYLEWMNVNLNILKKKGMDKINLELKYSLKTKIITGNKEAKQIEETKLSIYNLYDNSFILINNFYYEDTLINLINKNKKQNQLKKVSFEMLSEFSIAEDILLGVIRQFIKSISFENLSGGGLKYTLNHIDKQIFNKDISIFVRPKDRCDDQGFLSKPISIVSKGILVHILCLNENIQLHSSCIGGYTLLDEYRKTLIEVDNISVTTKSVYQLSLDVNPKYKVYKAHLNENNLVCLSLYDEKNLPYHITETIEDFLNSLVYVKEQRIYYYSKI